MVRVAAPAEPAPWVMHRGSCTVGDALQRVAMNTKPSWCILRRNPLRAAARAACLVSGIEARERTSLPPSVLCLWTVCVGPCSLAVQRPAPWNAKRTAPSLVCRSRSQVGVRTATLFPHPHSIQHASWALHRLMGNITGCHVSFLLMQAWQPCPPPLTCAFVCVCVCLLGVFVPSGACVSGGHGQLHRSSQAENSRLCARLRWLWQHPAA